MNSKSNIEILFNYIATILLILLYFFTFFRFYDLYSSRGFIDQGALFGLIVISVIIGLPILILYLIGFKKFPKFSITGIILLFVLPLLLSLYTLSK